MTTTRKDDDTILVVGSTGKTGRRVAERLAARGARVRHGSRAADPRFDWDDPATWGPALRGATAAYLTFFPDLAVPGAAAAVEAFTRRASESGLRRIVLLSGRGEPQVLPAEDAVRRSGLEHTILRASWFAQNFSEGQMLDAVRLGTIAFPAGDVAEPFVDAGDIADVAVAALTTDDHLGQTYDLTGPRLLTFAEVAATIGEATGRDVRYRAIPMAEYAAVLAQHVPPEMASFMCDLFAHVLDGHNATVGDGVPRALGRPARDFRDFARAAAASGAWG